MRAVRRPKKKNKHMGLRIVVGVIIAVILIAGIGWFVHRARIKKYYNEGIEAFKSNDYAKAEELLAKSENYKDSKKVIQICSVFDSLKDGEYKQASELAKDLSDYNIDDEETGKSIQETLESYYIQSKVLISSDNLQDAVYIFESLKDYLDSAQAAAYYDGVIHMNNDELEEAARLFGEAGDFEDASTLAQNCSNYLNAAQLQEKGDDASLAEADKIFSGLGDFKDSQARALACRSVALFKDAKAKVDKGDFKGAAKILDQYPANPYPGWAELKTQCDNEIDYQKAEEQYKKEHYFKAYKIYDTLGDYKDSKKKRDKCIKDNPSSSVLYQNSDYKSSAVELKFKNKGKKDNFIKLYNSDDTLVATVYVRDDSSATVHIPEGTYHINKAYGNTWFGEKDMFGDQGVYTKCKVNDGFDFSLKSGFIYTLSSDSGEGDPVTSQGVGSDKF